MLARGDFPQPARSIFVGDLAFDQRSQQRTPEQGPGLLSFVPLSLR
jgi:hypothetical protein